MSELGEMILAHVGHLAGWLNDSIFTCAHAAGSVHAVATEKKKEKSQGDCMNGLRGEVIA